jgi:hypothetical protein
LRGDDAGRSSHFVGNNARADRSQAGYCAMASRHEAAAGAWLRVSGAGNRGTARSGSRLTARGPWKKPSRMPVFCRAARRICPAGSPTLRPATASSFGAASTAVRAVGRGRNCPHVVALGFETVDPALPVTDLAGQSFYFAKVSPRSNARAGARPMLIPLMRRASLRGRRQGRYDRPGPIVIGARAPWSIRDRQRQANP